MWTETLPPVGPSCTVSDSFFHSTFILLFVCLSCSLPFSLSVHTLPLSFVCHEFSPSPFACFLLSVIHCLSLFSLFSGNVFYSSPLISPPSCKPPSPPLLGSGCFECGQESRVSSSQPASVRRPAGPLEGPRNNSIPQEKSPDESLCACACVCLCVFYPSVKQWKEQVNHLPLLKSKH